MALALDILKLTSWKKLCLKNPWLCTLFCLSKHGVKLLGNFVIINKVCAPDSRMFSEPPLPTFITILKKNSARGAYLSRRKCTDEFAALVFCALYRDAAAVALHDVFYYG